VSVWPAAGHIAGLVNPPDKHEISVWDRAQADNAPIRENGSPRAGEMRVLWPDCWSGFKEQDSTEVSVGASPGGGKARAARRDAPGRYVKPGLTVDATVRDGRAR